MAAADACGPKSEAPPAVRESAVREVFLEHAAFVWRTLRRLGVGDRDLADASQDAFLVVHRRFEDFEGRSSLKTWLYAICVRVAAAHRRKAHLRHEKLVGTPPAESVGAGQEDLVERARSRARLDAILGELDEAKRAVFILFEVEELPMVEVAKAVGCPLQTAYSRLHAAREEVLRAWKRFESKEQR